MLSFEEAGEEATEVEGDGRAEVSRDGLTVLAGIAVGLG